MIKKNIIPNEGFERDLTGEQLKQILKAVLTFSLEKSIEKEKNP